MKISKIFTLAAAVLLLGPVGCRKKGSAVSEALDGKIRELQAKLNVYPPVLASPEEAAKTEKLLAGAISSLEKLIKKNPEDAQLEWRLGECRRLEYNLNHPEAWAAAEHHLRRALAMDPNLNAARISVGNLYLNSGVDMAGRAEKEFDIALKVAGDKPLPEALKGLFLSYYYEGRFAEAVQEADRYLALAPTDEGIRKMRAMAATNMPKLGRPRS